MSSSEGCTSRRTAAILSSFSSRGFLAQPGSHAPALSRDSYGGQSAASQNQSLNLPHAGRLNFHWSRMALNTCGTTAVFPMAGNALNTLADHTCRGAAHHTCADHHTVDRPPHIKGKAKPAGRSHDCLKKTTSGRTGPRPWGDHLTDHVAKTQCEFSKVLVGSFPAKVFWLIG